MSDYQMLMIVFTVMSLLMMTQQKNNHLTQC